jgi:3-oxoacyl-[acyl-carrier-protein] synthase III
MALVSFEEVGLIGIKAAVPKNKIVNREQTQFFDKGSIADIVDKTGIEERRHVLEDVCASDLCFAAAEALITELALEKSEIDLLIFISQTPDYRMPATSVILQHRLGLLKTCAAFDISLGCSAFVYGLSVAFSLAQTGAFRNILLLDGETRSKVYHPKDRKTGFLFGDGGIACIIRKDNKFGNSYFSLNSDGSKEDLIKIPAGGYRNPSSKESVEERLIDEYGNISTEEHGRMLGADVFNFVLQEIPKNIKEILAYSKTEIQAIDSFVFHQANAFMNEYLAQKLKLPLEKVPQSLRFFGNTSSVSIPLTICTQFNKGVMPNMKFLFSGFGVGMSWASSVIETIDLYNGGLIEI